MFKCVEKKGIYLRIYFINIFTIFTLCALHSTVSCYVPVIILTEDLKW